LLYNRTKQNQTHILLVGNASKIIGMGLANKIDKYNEVVRFNGFSTNDPFGKSVGHKTDVFFCTDVFVSRISELNIKKNIVYNPHRRNLSKQFTQFIIDHRHHEDILKFYPYPKYSSTGFMAIYLYLQKHRTVTITNFDFQLDMNKTTEYYDVEKKKPPKTNPNHDFVFEKQYVQNLIDLKRVIVLENMP
jgi:hypothetical protein